MMWTSLFVRASRAPSMKAAARDLSLARRLLLMFLGVRSSCPHSFADYTLSELAQYDLPAQSMPDFDHRSTLSMPE